MGRFGKEINEVKITSNYKWWNKELKKFNNEINISTNLEYQKMGKRINYALYAMAIENSYSQLKQNNIDKALYCHNLVVLMIPDKPYPYILLAQDYALLNQEEKVYENLESAISKGHVNKKILLETKEFAKFKNSERFEILISKLNE